MNLINELRNYKYAPRGESIDDHMSDALRYMFASMVTRKEPRHPYRKWIVAALLVIGSIILLKVIF